MKFVDPQSRVSALHALVAYLAFCALALTLTGCDMQKVMNAFVPEKEAAVGKSYVEDIRTRNFAPVEARIDARYRDAALRGKLEAMAADFPNEAPKTIKVVGSNIVTINGRTSYNFTYEYEFPHGWVLGHITYTGSGGDMVIAQMDIHPMRLSLEQANAFTLAGKTPAYLGFLALAVLLPIFTIGTAIACARTRVPKRKWLWIIFILIAFPACSLNWTTGAWAINPFSLIFLGGGFKSAPYGPVILQIGFPLGAILFWIRRRKWEADREAMSIRDATTPFR